LKTCISSHDKDFHFLCDVCKISTSGAVDQMCVYVCVHLYLCTCVYVYVYMSVCVYICVCLCVCMSMKVKITQCVQLFANPWTMEFSRPEYWSGQPFPSPGDLPNPGIEPRSPALQVYSLPAEPQGSPMYVCVCLYLCVCICLCVSIFVCICVCVFLPALCFLNLPCSHLSSLLKCSPLRCLTLSTVYRSPSAALTPPWFSHIP